MTAEVLVGGTADLGDDLAHTGGVHFVGVVGDLHLGDDFRLCLLDQRPVVGGCHAV